MNVKCAAAATLLLSLHAGCFASDLEFECEQASSPLMKEASTWSELKVAAINFRDSCFDGYIGEGISENLTRKAVLDWPGFLSVLSSDCSQPLFKLLLDSLNATVDENRLRELVRLSGELCPADAADKCGLIVKASIAAIEDFSN